MTPAELPAYLAKLRAQLEDKAPPRVAYAIAREFHEEVVDVTLTKYTHKLETPTPSPPGEPPAAIGGALRRSVRLYAATRVGASSAEAKVIPTIVYARIQELGGTIVPHGHPYLRFKIGGHYVYAKSVTLPPRPYMRPTHKKMVASGALRNAAIEELKVVLAEVIGG